MYISPILFMGKIIVRNSDFDKGSVMVRGRHVPEPSLKK